MPASTTPPSAATPTPLTTISRPIQSLDRELARMLLATIAGQTPTPLILQIRLV
jgi:DNA-binding LacI/PurR family transcriptional regulator